VKTGGLLYLGALPEICPRHKTRTAACAECSADAIHEQTIRSDLASEREARIRIAACEAVNMLRRNRSPDAILTILERALEAK
jgi:hypothetical protein